MNEEEMEKVEEQVKVAVENVKVARQTLDEIHKLRVVYQFE